MKKLLILIVLIVSIIALAYLLRNGDSPQLGFQKPDNTNTFQPNPSNASFLFDDGTVTLSNGSTRKKVAPDSDLIEEVTLLDKVDYGDINSDSKDDAVVFIARSGAGSGTFIYVAAFISGPINYKGSNAIFLGDRISPQDISISNEIVTIKYLDRGEDESFSAEPTIPVSKQFVLRNGVFEER